MRDTNESKDLIEIKEGIWNKVKNWFKNFFKKDNDKEYEISSIQNSNHQDKKEKNNILLNAKRAFENYNLHKNPEITKIICSYIQERMEANAYEIEQVIEMDNARITYNDIIEIFEYEMKKIDEYKQTISMEKIDNNFILASYKVPKGIIKIYSDKPVTTVRNIFKAVITRNSIVIVESNYEKYSVQNLILLIVQGLLKKFNVDENIIQVVSKNEDVESIKGFDEIIYNSNSVTEKNNEVVEKAKSDMCYIYMQDDFFADFVKNEVRQMNLAGCKTSVITGEFETAVEQINQTQNLGVSIYTQDRKLAYKFINLINSDNVYANASIVDVKDSKGIDDKFFRVKNIAYENGHI